MSTEARWYFATAPVKGAYLRKRLGIPDDATVTDSQSYIGTFYGAGRWCEKDNVFVGSADHCPVCGAENPMIFNDLPGPVRGRLGFIYHVYPVDKIRAICNEFPDKIVCGQDNNGGRLTGKELLEKLDSCVVVKRSLR